MTASFLFLPFSCRLSCCLQKVRVLFKDFVLGGKKIKLHDVPGREWSGLLIARLPHLLGLLKQSLFSLVGHFES